MWGVGGETQVGDRMGNGDQEHVEEVVRGKEARKEEKKETKIEEKRRKEKRREEKKT